MKRRIVYLLVLCLSLWAGLATAQEPKTEQAVSAAQEWLSLVDAGDYTKSWQEAAEYFKSAVTEEKWVQSIQPVRDPLGKLVSRKVRSTSIQRTLPGAPDGEYVIIRFETSFENKKSAVETVTPMLEKDGSWRVSGYYIK